MRGFIRVVACLAVALFVVGLVKQRPWDFASPRSGRAGLPVRQVAEPVEPRSGRAGLPVRQVAEPVEPRSGGAGLPQADATAPNPYRSPMVRAIGGMIEQHSEVFSGTDGELQDNLARADAILAESRSNNRDALRQANRQVRLPGRSPHLLIVLVDGLQCSDLKCYGSIDNATPASDRLAREGIRATGFTLNTPGANENLFSLLSGYRPPASPAAEPTGARLRLAEMLWRSGYTPALLGNRFATGWRADPSVGWELSFGWQDAPGSKTNDWAPFPPHVSSGGKTIRVAHANKSDPPPFSQLLLDEAASLVRSRKARRPVAIVVATPLAWWQALENQNSSLGREESAAGPASRAAAVARWDEFLGRLVESLDAEVGKNQLVVLLAGISGEPSARSREDVKETKEIGSEEVRGLASRFGTAPLLVRWPNHLSAGAVVESPVEPADLLPTIADLIESTRRPNGGSGRSQWNAWRTLGVGL